MRIRTTGMMSLIMGLGLALPPLAPVPRLEWLNRCNTHAQGETFPAGEFPVAISWPSLAIVPLVAKEPLGGW
jgi:hypothetical protein